MFQPLFNYFFIFCMYPSLFINFWLLIETKSHNLCLGKFYIIRSYNLWSLLTLAMFDIKFYIWTYCSLGESLTSLYLTIGKKKNTNTLCSCNSFTLKNIYKCKNWKLNMFSMLLLIISGETWWTSSHERWKRTETSFDACQRCSRSPSYHCFRTGIYLDS